MGDKNKRLCDLYDQLASPRILRNVLQITTATRDWRRMTPQAPQSADVGPAGSCGMTKRTFRRQHDQ